MKREIKFRAWDHNTDTMMIPDNFEFCDGEICWIDAGREAGPTSGNDGDSGQFEIMQYTGLHDKNEREIYEGDLLRVELDDDPDSYYIAPVTWGGSDYPAFDIMSKYWPKNVSYDTNVLSAIIAGWSEEVMSVIGNIYENPEMLEEADHEEAYSTIKNRTGKMINGVFVKTVDLQNADKN